MCKRSLSLGLLAALIGGLGGGCKKSTPAPSLLPSALPPVEAVAAVHWLGKQRLAADTNAATLIGIWNLAESKKLEAQTLDRLAMGLLATNSVSSLKSKVQTPEGQPSAEGNPKAEARSPKEGRMTNDEGRMPNDKAIPHPADASRSNAPAPPPLTGSRPNAQNSKLKTQNSPLLGPAALLRPLLEDLLNQESYTKIRQASNAPGELTLAIRLNEERARLWETNLAALLEALTPGRAAVVPGRTNGWQISVHGPQSAAAGLQSTRTVDFARVGEWTVVGLAPGSNAFFGEAVSLFRENPAGEGLASTNSWLFADLDLGRIASALSLSWALPVGLPRMILIATGDGKTVQTRGQLNFAQPLPFELEPWNIPTNLIHGPLLSFTAVQGIRPWLSSLKLWQGLELGPPPNQLFFWAQNGPEVMSYFAAPMANASNCVERATDRLLGKPNAYLTTEGIGRFERSTNGPGAVWTDVPLMAPYLQSVALTEGDFVVGGLIPSPLTNRPPPAGLLHAVLGDTNLLAYDWELTGPRLHNWLNFGQLVRLALHLAQEPPSSASVAWLNAIEPKLVGCLTAVVRTGPAQLSLVRRSELGFSAAELDWLADWLDSPQFPRGLNSFLGEPTRIPRKPVRQPRGGSGTNSVPPAHP